MSDRARSLYPYGLARRVVKPLLALRVILARDNIESHVK